MTVLRDRTIVLPFAPRRAVAFLAAVLALAALVWPHRGYVPIWDGRVYANCVMDAAYNGLTMETLRCAGHPSQAWALAMALPQLIDPGNVVLLHATSFLLGVAALAGFRVVLARVVPDPSRAGDLDLLVGACAVHPVVVSTLLQPNVDFGVYAFFLVALAGLLTPTRRGTVVAIVAGTALAFSKETGVAAYALAAGTALAVEGWRAQVGVAGAVRRLWRRALVLALPGALFAAHVLIWNATHAQGAIWKHGWQKTTADGLQFFDLSDPVFVSYAAGLFVLGFGWLVWVPVALDAVVGALRTVRRRATRQLEGCDATLAVAMVTFTCVLTYLLTSFRTWSNLRYFALLYPLFLLVAYLSMTRLGWGTVARRGAIGAWIVFFLVAQVSSADPLSRAVYGTFGSGAGMMYRMSAITREYDGPGRDQLVYNLQFTSYHDVQDALFDRIHPGDSTVIGTPRYVRWNIWSQLDRATGHRTLRRTGAFSPIYADEVDIPARRSPEAWFVEFSNHPDNDHSLEQLEATYAVTDSVTVVTHGQRLIARRLVRRQSGQVLP